MRVWSGWLFAVVHQVENFLHRLSKEAGQLERQERRWCEFAGLDRMDRQPGHTDGIGERLLADLALVGAEPPEMIAKRGFHSWNRPDSLRTGLILVCEKYSILYTMRTQLLFVGIALLHSAGGRRACRDTAFPRKSGQAFRTGPGSPDPPCIGATHFATHSGPVHGIPPQCSVQNCGVPHRISLDEKGVTLYGPPLVR